MHKINKKLFHQFQGKVKSKKADSLVKSISERDLGCYSSGQYTNKAGQTATMTRCPLKDLQVKINEGRVALGVVVCNVYSNEAVPL